MADREHSLERIAAALERLAPPSPVSVDWLAAPAYIKDAQGVRAISAIEALPLDKLRGVEKQKTALCENLNRLANNAAAHDVLLWGARGMGKSALIRSCVNALNKEHRGMLALIQITSDALDGLHKLIEDLRGLDRAFLLFVDDLGFDGNDSTGNLALRSLLDGSVSARPANIRLAVTSNRRAIVIREGEESNAMHERDERDNSLALADRFGLTLGFHPCDKQTYLEILHAYTDPLGLQVDEEEAMEWAITRGNRSGRTAYQFACEMAGRAGLAL